MTNLAIFQQKYWAKIDHEEFLISEKTKKILENPDVPENSLISIDQGKRQFRKWAVKGVRIAETTAVQVARAKHDAYLRECAKPKKLSPEEKKKREEKIRLMRQELINKGVIEDPSV